MKYLFFDVECSNCFNDIGKIVEFGFTIVDENFKVLRNTDFIMSPGKGKENDFYLKGRKGHRDLILSFEEEFYFKQEEFPYYYLKIKNLLEDENTLVFAWSSENDILHLYNTCLRYKKEPINYKCIDVQKIAMEYLDSKNQISLDKACDLILGKGATIGLQKHASKDDSMMTMMILEGICALENKTLNKKIEESICFQDEAIELAKNIIKHKKEIRDNKESKEYYKKIIRLDSKLLNDPNYKGDKYYLSSEIKVSRKELVAIIDKIHSSKGILVKHVDVSSYYLVKDEDELNILKVRNKDRFKGSYILLNEFMKRDKYMG